MKMIPFDSFYKKFMIRNTAHLKNPKDLVAGDVVLPKGAVIHYMPEGGTELGIDMSHCLMRNSADRALVYHVEEMVSVAGKTSKLSVKASSLARIYHKRYRTMVKVRDLDKALDNTRYPLVMNYAMLPRLFKHVQNNMITYHEWSNYRATMWRQIEMIGAEREHLIRFRLPESIPSKEHMTKAGLKFTTTSLDNFHTSESLDLLELWKIIDPEIETQVDKIDPEIRKHVNLAFVESNYMAIINLGDLYEWMEDGSIKTQLYTFFDSMLSHRSVADTKAVTKALEEVDEDGSEGDVGETIIGKLINDQATAGHLSTAEQKGLIKLAKRYKKLPNPITGEGTLEEAITITPEELELKPKALMNKGINTLKPSMAESRVAKFDTDYISKVMDKDILSMGVAIQSGGVILKNVKVTEKNTAATKSRQYSIQLQPVGGKASTIKFTVPIIAEDGTFRASNTQYRLEKQVGDYPILKIKPSRVALSSYYGKCFITRNENASSDLGRWLRGKILARSVDVQDKTITSVGRGRNKFIGVTLPRVYSAIGVEMSTFKTPTHTFYWNYNDLPKFFSEAELKNKYLKASLLIPCGRTKAGILGMDKTGIVYQVKPDGVESLGSVASIIDPALGEGPIEFTEMSIFSKRIPLMLAFMYRFGMDKAFKMLGLDVTHMSSGSRTPLGSDPNYYKFKIKDEDLYIRISDPKHSLMVGGLNSIRRLGRSYNNAAYNKKTVYATLLAQKGLGVYHLRELDLMFDMYIDPITKEVLESIEEPTHMPKLLLRANELLVDDFTPKDEKVRYKGYERISGMVYLELVAAMRAFRNQGNNPNAEVGMKPSAVWLSVLKDESIAIIEQVNPIHNLKEKEAVTYSGAGGRSGRTMTIENRAYVKADLGVISEASPDSSKVGIRTFMSANPNLKNLRGITLPHDPTKDEAVNMLSTSSLLSPGATHDTMNRANFINIQYGRTTSSLGYEVQPFRTGYEQVIAHRVDKSFARDASQPGKITEVKDDVISVLYKDGTSASFALGIVHGNASGATIPHTIITDLKKGQSVKQGDIIAYNENFFARDELNPSTVSYKTGAVARVALMDAASTLEDGSTVSATFAKRLGTPATGNRDIHIEFDKNVHNLVKVGDMIDAEDILCTLEDSVLTNTDDDNHEVGLALSRITASNPKAKYTGVISDIEVLYHGDIEDMSTSLQAAVKSGDKRRASKVKRLSNGDAKVGKVDEIIQIGNKKLTEGTVNIRVYIDYVIGMGTGDKIVFGNQLKSTCSAVDAVAATTESGEEIDATFGYSSVSERTVESSNLMGTMNRVLKELSHSTAQIYKG